METDSEDEGSQKRRHHSYYPPYLKLFEEEEYEERSREERNERNNGVANVNFKHFWKFHRANRFFSSIAGFHEVSTTNIDRRIKLIFH
jgi:hypothetical protein